MEAVQCTQFMIRSIRCSEYKNAKKRTNFKFSICFISSTFNLVVHTEEFHRICLFLIVDIFCFELRFFHSNDRFLLTYNYVDILIYRAMGSPQTRKSQLHVVQYLHEEKKTKKNEKEEKKQAIKIKHSICCFFFVLKSRIFPYF